MRSIMNSASSWFIASKPLGRPSASSTSLSPGAWPRPSRAFSMAGRFSPTRGWATDDDFWIRRAALLALLIPLRQGAGDFDRFARYADALLDEREFFIRKAIGWVLRDTARKRPDLVYEWFLPRAARASGVTVREVLKPLSDAQRAAIQAARTAG